MAWICIDWDGTLVQTVPGEDGQSASAPVDGAVEAVTQLMQEGHRLTIWTARLKPMSDSMRHRLAEELQEQASQMGFPTMEVWEGSTKPAADAFIDNKAITFDGDWGLALAQLTTMLQDQGLQQLQPAAEPPEPTP